MSFPKNIMILPPLTQAKSKQEWSRRSGPAAPRPVLLCPAGGRRGAPGAGRRPQQQQAPGQRGGLLVRQEEGAPAGSKGAQDGHGGGASSPQRGEPMATVMIIIIGRWGSQTQRSYDLRRRPSVPQIPDGKKVAIVVFAVSVANSELADIWGQIFFGKRCQIRDFM